MANSAQVQYNGADIEVVLDAPLDGSMTPVTLSEGSYVFNETLLLSDVSVTVGGTRTITAKQLKGTKCGFNGSNQLTFRFGIDYPWALDRIDFDETDIVVNLPANLVTQGGFGTAAATIAATTDSFWCDPYDQHKRITADHEIVYIDEATGNDATGVVYTKATLPVPNNTRYPGAVMPFQSQQGAILAIRDYYPTVNWGVDRERLYAVLYKGGVPITIGRTGTSSGTGLLHARTQPPHATKRTKAIVCAMYDCEPGTKTPVTGTAFGRRYLSAMSGGVAVEGGFEMADAQNIFHHPAGPIRPSTLGDTRAEYIFLGPSRTTNCDNRIVWLADPSTAPNPVLNSWGAGKIIVVQPMADRYGFTGTTNPSAYSIDRSVLPNGDPLFRDVQFIRMVAGLHDGDDNGLSHVAYTKGFNPHIDHFGCISQNSRNFGTPKSDGMVECDFSYWLVGDSEGSFGYGSSLNLECNGSDVEENWGWRSGTPVDRADYGPNEAGMSSVRNAVRNFVICGATGTKIQSSYEDLIEKVLFIGSPTGIPNLYNNATNPGSPTPQASVGEGFRTIMRRCVSWSVGNGRGVITRVPESDDLTQENTVGYHGNIVENCIIAGDGTTQLARVDAGVYTTARDAGRCSMTVRNCTFHDADGPTGKYLENATTYNSLAAYAAATDDLIDNCDELDPQFVDPTRDLDAYATLQGYADQTELHEAFRDQLWAGTLPLALREDTMANWILAGFMPQNSTLLAANRFVPLWTSTTDPEATATPTFTTTANVDITDTVIDISTNRSTTPLSVQVRLHIADAALDTGDVVSLGASGKLAISTTTDSSGSNFVFGTDTIAEDDYITFNLTLDRSLAGVFPTDLDAPSGNILTIQLASVTIKIGYNLTVTGTSSGSTFVRRVLGRAAGRLRSFRPAAAANPMQFLWWDDFRVSVSDSPFRAALAVHPNAYAPILTTKGQPTNQFQNAYDWSAVNATTLLPVNPFPNTAAGCGESYANAYLHTVRFLMGERFDGSIPFCCYPNGWGLALADNTSTAANSSDWLANRDPQFVRLGRNDADLLPSTYLTVAVDAKHRGNSGYAENGIAACYAWWVDFFEAAKAYIDTAVGHTRTPVEIYDDLEGQGPDLNYILQRITTGESTHRVFDVIQADPRWSTELVNGFQTWEDFFNTLETSEQDQLENSTNTSVFGNDLTRVAEKLGVFRNTCHAYQIDQSLVKAARDVFGSRFRFACEYGITPESSVQGTINDRTVSPWTDRIFENRGPLTLPTGWGAAPVCYQLFGIRDNATAGNLNTLASVMGYTRTGSGPTFGASGGAAADGRLFNIARLRENVRRVRSFGVDTVPWYNYIPASGQQSPTVVDTVPMTSADHVALLKYWRSLGINRIILWGDPFRDFNDDPLNPPLVDHYESDFKTLLNEVLPNL